MNTAPGTESAISPTFSRDGTWLAFHSSDRSQVGVMPAGGGTPEWLDVPARFAWGDDGAIYYRSDGEILRWAPGTADPEPVGTEGGLVSGGNGGVVTGSGLDWPELLPAASKAATV